MAVGAKGRKNHGKGDVRCALKYNAYIAYIASDETDSGIKK
jgi:hypothetical protein